MLIAVTVNSLLISLPFALLLLGNIVLIVRFLRYLRLAQQQGDGAPTKGETLLFVVLQTISILGILLYWHRIGQP
jgi:heme/copper-type cytochrome/quinol oxidase subunit 2